MLITYYLQKICTGTHKCEIMKATSGYFYSNCLIEALKAKLHDRRVKMYRFHKSDNVVYCPHIMWSDGEYDYDFGIEQHIPLLAAWTIHKGHIRRYRLGTIQRCYR